MPNISDAELQRITRALKEAAEIKKRNSQLIDNLGPAIVNALEPAIRQSFKDIQVQVNPTVEPKIDTSQMEAVMGQLSSRLENLKIPAPDNSSIEGALAEVTNALKSIKIPAPKVTVKPPSNKLLTKQLTGIKKAISEQHSAVDRMVAPELKGPIKVIPINELGKPWQPLQGASKAVAQMIKNQAGVTAELDEGTAERALRVVHASDAAASVHLATSDVSIGGGTQYEDGDTADPATGTVAMGDTGEESGNVFAVRTGAGVTDSSTIRVVQAVDSVASVNIVSGSSSGTEYSDGATAEPSTGAVAMGDTGEESGNVFALRTANGVMDSSTLRVLMATDSVASVNIVGGSSSGTEYDDGAKDATPTGTLAMGYDGEESEFALRTTSGAADSATLRVVHATDVGMSTSVTDGTLDTVTAVTDITNSVKVSTLPETIQTQLDAIETATEATQAAVEQDNQSFEVKQTSGFISSVKVTGFDTSVGATILDGDGNGIYTFGGGTQYTEGDIDSSFTGNIFLFEGDDNNAQAISSTVPAPVTLATKLDKDNDSITTYAAGGSNQSVSIKSTDVSFETKQVSGFSDSVYITGSADSHMAYQARTTNPTAKSDGADVRPSTDDLGRPLIRPIQVRDLMATAYATTSSEAETTILAGAAGVFHDCVMLTATNLSTSALRIDIRAVTGGNIVHTMRLPADTGPMGWTPSVPWPQDATGNNWTFQIDGSDITNTDVAISGLFTKEV